MNLASEAFAQGDIERMKELVYSHVPHLAENFSVSTAPSNGIFGGGRDIFARDGPAAFGVGPSKIWQSHLMARSWPRAIGTRSTIHVYDRESMRLLCSPLPAGSNFDRLRFFAGRSFSHRPRRQPMPVLSRYLIRRVGAASTHSTAGPTSAIAFAKDQPVLASDGWGETMLWNTDSMDGFRFLADQRSQLAPSI